MPYNKEHNKRNIPIYVWPVLLFGRFATNFGLMFFGFALVFIIAFSSVVKFEKLSTSSPTTTGIVISAEPTKSEVNEQRVFAYQYLFSLNDNVEYKGISYSEEVHFEPNDTVTIQYSAKDPSISRIQGMRSGEIGVWILFIFTPFLLVGLGFMIFGFRKAAREVYLLKYGVLALGKLAKKEETSVHVNHARVYKMHFQFSPSKGNKITVICKTHKTSLLDDGELKRLLYNPSNPEKVIMLDLLPQSLKGVVDRVKK